MTPLNFVWKICVDSSNTFQNSSPVQMHDSAFSMDWEQPVRVSPTCRFFHIVDIVLTAVLRDTSFYDVYTQLAEFHLDAVGIDIEWEDVDVAKQEAIRWGDTRGYFCMRLYRLPVGRIASRNNTTQG
jgi:hypothetical protein